MADASRPDAGTWLIEPAAGVAALATDVVTAPG
jgi:hypothetical protein